jgi:hypothetical protein
MPPELAQEAAVMIEQAPLAKQHAPAGGGTGQGFGVHEPP